MSIHDLLLERTLSHPHELAVQDERGCWTYAQLDETAQIQCHALRARGVEPGERVAVLAKNRAEYVALYFAVSRLGAVLVPLNWRLTRDELHWILSDAQPVQVIAESTLAAALARTPFTTFESLVAEATPHQGPEASPPDAVAVLMYTSGTSGRPKGAALTHGNCLAMTRSWLQDMPLSPGDRFLQVTPLFHVGGMLMVLSAITSGAGLRLIEEFDPASTIDVLSDEAITHTLMVPAMLQWVLREPHVEGRHFDALKLIVYGAAPMPAATLEAARVMFACDFLQGYGLTETTGVLLTLTSDDHRTFASDPAKLRSAGTAADGCTVRVVDEHGDDVLPSTRAEPGAIGEVVARGANICSSYWRNPHASQAAWSGGWFHTGDLAQIDEAGYITVVDRKKDMLLVGGENVYPREIELILLQHEAIADAAVIGIPHSIWGEEALALVVATEGHAPNRRELILHCRKHLARFKCPTRIELRKELQRNVSGKLMKRDLRAPYWKDQERQI